MNPTKSLKYHKFQLHKAHLEENCSHSSSNLKRALFLRFFTFQQIFSHMSYHHISLMCILLLCIVHEKSEYYNMCDGSNPTKTISLNPFELDISNSELTWAKKLNSKPKLFQKVKLWTCLFRNGLQIYLAAINLDKVNSELRFNWFHGSSTI